MATWARALAAVSATVREHEVLSSRFQHPGPGTNGDPRVGMADPSVVTWRLAPGQRRLDPADRDLVAAVLRRGDGARYQLLAFVVMDDHVHVLARGAAWPLERATAAWQSSSAQQLQRIRGRRGEVWGPGRITQPLRTPAKRRDAEFSIVGNPWKRWPFLQGYPWLWTREGG